MSLKSLYYSFLSFIFISTSAFSTDISSKQLMSGGFPNSLGNRDFFSFKSSTPIKKDLSILSEQKQENCREQIEKVVCLVNPTKEGEKPQDRPCLVNSKSYATYFEHLYDNYPATMQKVFCSLKHLFIEKEFDGTAWAGTIRDANGNTDGAMMGIRQSVLDENLNLTLWASWKEQLSFGGFTGSYATKPDLPFITTNSQTNANDFLYFVVSHEFAHILDFANDVNRMLDCPSDPDETKECRMHEGSWGAISWETNQRPLPKNEFSNRTGLCFYWCNESPLQKTDVPQIYADLANTDFISTYATTQPWDDFADSLAYFLMYKNTHSTYKISTRQQAEYDIIEKLNSSVFKQKFEYLENFLNRTDIIYP